MKYEETVFIKKEEYEKINQLLEIESLEEMTDNELLAAGANTHVCKGVYGVVFDDGSSLQYNLCSGASNYWDDVIFSNDVGDYVLDCTYEFGDIEVEIDGNTYSVKLNIV